MFTMFNGNFSRKIDKNKEKLLASYPANSFHLQTLLRPGDEQIIQDHFPLMKSDV